MPAKTFTGSMGIVRIDGIPVGHFDSVNWGATLDLAPIPVLGRFTVAETVYTGAEPIRVTATGWRVITPSGLQGQVKFPSIQQLITSEYFQMDVINRQTGKRVAVIRDVRADTYSTGLAARQASQVSYTFIAILVDDEVSQNAETPGAGDLPPVN